VERFDMPDFRTDTARAWLSVSRWVCLLLVCGPYVQGGLTKLFDFSGATAEMRHFGLTPAAPFAACVLLLELIGSLAVLCGVLRYAGALALALFTVGATLTANRFWALPPTERFMATNAFFEHLGLAGALMLVAWHDVRTRMAANR
jgi:uncharacterized membrane protein YphA (DoxX/SURF4 family)